MTSARTRTATTADRDAIRALHLGAFPAAERDLVARCALDLLAERSTPATFALVAELDGALVGHVAFSPVAIPNEIAGETAPRAWILAPLAVDPTRHGGGIGSRLVRDGIDRLIADGAELVFVYGDPLYYGRFGFDASIALPFAPPYELEHPFGWLAMMLHAGVSTPADRPAASIRLDCVASLRDPALW